MSDARHAGMAKQVTMEKVYDRFAAIWADSRPMADEDMLRAALSARGIALGEVTDEWLRSLKADWVYLDSEQPFEEPTLNQKYQRLVTR